jgi:hypothetical protein
MSEEEKTGDTPPQEPETKVNDWVSNLPEDLRVSESITKYKSVEELAKGHVNLSKMIGKDKIALLNENSTDEEKDSFYKALGRPDDVSGYEINLEGDDIEINETRMEEFKGVAHKIGLNPQQAQVLAEFDIANQRAMVEQQEQQRAEAIAGVEAQLRREMGQTFDSQLSNVKNLVEKYFDEDGRADLYNLETNPSIVRGLAKLAKDMGADTLVDGNKGSLLTPNQAQAELATLKQSDAYLNASHIEHEAVMAKARELVEISAGS